MVLGEGKNSSRCKAKVNKKKFTTNIQQNNLLRGLNELPLILDISVIGNNNNISSNSISNHRRHSSISTNSSSNNNEFKARSEFRDKFEV